MGSDEEMRLTLDHNSTSSSPAVVSMITLPRVGSAIVCALSKRMFGRPPENRVFVVVVQRLRHVTRMPSKYITGSLIHDLPWLPLQRLPSDESYVTHSYSRITPRPRPTTPENNSRALGYPSSRVLRGRSVAVDLEFQQGKHVSEVVSEI
jgi:hypothetical protein